MFENLIADIKRLIAAIRSPSVDSIGDALESAGNLLKQGWTLFKDLFGNVVLSAAGDPVTVCEAWVAEMECAPAGAKAQAFDLSKLLALLALIRKVFDMFPLSQPETAAA